MSEELVFELDEELEEESDLREEPRRPRILVNNPVGPLPNVRLRYLADEIVEAYTTSALHDAMRDKRGRTVPRVGSMMVWLARGRDRAARPSHLKQVGLVDRFADRPYGMRNW